MASTNARPALPTDDITLIPEPTSVTLFHEKICLPIAGTIGYVGPKTNDGSQAESMLAYEVAESIEERTALRWDCTQGDGWNAFIRLIVDDSLSARTYTVHIERSADPAVTVRGADTEALRYGVQTLRQIIRQCAPTLPCLHIEDKPAFTVRSYSLDVTRGRVPTMRWLKHWADKLSLYKYNQLQLYVEHSFAFDELSETWRGVSPLKPTDIQEFDDYCRRRGIELVPSLSTFGHHYMNLRTHTMRALGEFPGDAERRYSFIERQEHHTLNITMPEAFEFSTRIIDEYAGLFHSAMFNIGADETFDLGKGASKQQALKSGVSNMYADYVSRLCEHITRHGGRPMFWGDIAISMPEILDRLPENGILLNWQYSPEVNEDTIKIVADHGVRQYVCSAIHDWNNLLPDYEAAWKNITRMDEFGLRHGAIGAMVTDWGDYGNVNDPRMSVPGMIYGSQYSWNPHGPGFDEMNRRISRLEYGDMSGEYVDTLVQAGNETRFSWADMVTYRELDDGNGGLNDDVSRMLEATFGQDRWNADGVTTVAEARERYLKTKSESLRDSGGCDERLAQLAEKLGTILSRATHANDAFNSAQAQLIAIAGQRLFNELGDALAVNGRKIEETSRSSGLGNAGYALASRIEEWFETYRSVWRQVSRESELRRIADVIWDYADMLRRSADSQEHHNDGLRP